MSALARSLARWTFGREGISNRLERSATVQRLADRFQIRRWINKALALRPIQRCHRKSGIRYEIKNFETLSVEKSYFGNSIYREIFLPNPPKTFIDLGCNSGIFPCFISHLAEGRPPTGICIDANLDQMSLAQQNVQMNDWPEVKVWHGLVGANKPAAQTADFFLHPTSLGSSQFPYLDSESGHPPSWKKTEAPILRVKDLWSRCSFGRCDCLKIDIEGSEMNFLRQEVSMLSQVDSILIEWHAWATTRDEVTSFLEDNHFELKRVIEDESRHGVLFFRRSPSVLPLLNE